MTTDELIIQCHAETAAFFGRQYYDESMCLELLRRAIAEHDQLACAGVYDVYGALVAGWVMGQNGIRHTLEEPEYLVNEAFRRFFRYLRPDMLASMRLAEALAYLRRCVAGSVIDAGRKASRNRVEMVSDDPLIFRPAPGSLEDDVVARMTAAELFRALWRRCANDRERVVAARSLLQGWRPAEIVEAHGEMFASVGEIYACRAVLTARLRTQQTAFGWANRWMCA